MWQRPRPGIELQRAEGWSFFDDTLQPTAVDLDWILNARIVQSAIEAGSDRQLAHRIEHVFVGPRERLLELLATLQRDGLGDHVWEGDALVVTQSLPLDATVITEWTQRLRAAAAAHGVEYDGWGTPITRP